MNPFAGYRITSAYGPRIHPVTGLPHFHTGIDLVKSFRAPIPAFVGGQVLHAGEGRAGTGFGNMGIVVAVQDQYGSLHCYVHLDSVSASVGDIVRQGQEIGKQGNSGKFTTGTHLHYEIRKKAAPSFGWIDSEKDRCHEPTQYLTDYFAKEEDQPMNQAERDALDALLRRVTKLEEDNAALKKLCEASERQRSMPCPAWARPAIDAARRTIGPDGNPVVIDADGGSYDFYRFVSVLHRAGLIK